MVEYGGGSAPILFEKLTCIGTEHNLSKCNHSNIGRHDCFYFLETFGVSCGKLHILFYALPCTHCVGCFSLSAPSCTEGKLRLLKDRVQICQNKRWSYVCRDDGWSLKNARVVCRELGFSTKGCIECSS